MDYGLPVYCFATLLKPHYGIGVFLQICCISSELFLQEHLWRAASGDRKRKIVLYKCLSFLCYFRQ